jgi:hypothetical protein
MEIKTMANPANNPLFKHFRQPAIYIKLPSGGKYYADSAIDFPVTGDIPVFPMTVKDELTLKTPDALLNGVGMIEVVKSCCPNIKDPWQMPAVDVDPVFIAIRLASYGPSMDVATQCPHCSESNEHSVDLRVVLENYKPADFTRPAFISELKIQFKPQTYFDINQINLINFEEQRLIDSVINNANLSEFEKKAKFEESFEKLKQMNISVVRASIESITTEEGVEVKDAKMIDEFLDNCSREVYTQIKDAIAKLNDENRLKPMTLACSDCAKEYENTLIFDQSNFFG